MRHVAHSMRRWSLAQCLVCSERLVNVIYEEHGLLAIHCGMQKGAVDSRIKIFWFSFCMSTCCDKYKHSSPCIHACIHSVHPSFPSSSSLAPSPPDHPPTIHSSIYPQSFILSSDTRSMPIVYPALSWTLVNTR